MIDEIIYCSDLGQLMQELEADGKTEIDGITGEVVYTHGNLLTPVIKTGDGKSLSLVRDNKLDMSKYPSLKSLGTYDELFANEDSLALYKSVYPYDVPIEYKDENGDTHTYMRPEKIGSFL